MESLYGPYAPFLPKVAEDVETKILAIGEAERERTGHGVIEHVRTRIKAEESMREKCLRRGFEPSAYSALREIHDSVGIRVVTRFIDELFLIADRLRELPDTRIVSEKDYVRSAKPNGYRSYHMILEINEPFTDILGRTPGGWIVEVQLRTIAMDTWASLEHELRYKQDVANERLIAQELKRVADELASCDVSMQTIRNLIHAS